ncbi:MAG: spondin domain-containing protein, partial [Gammaproteobacteria bacterium]
MLKNRITALATVAALALTATPALADRDLTYEVTITNITQGQTFTPFLLATHKSSVALFDVGTKAGPALELLAEGGATGPLAEMLKHAGKAVGDIEEGDTLLVPGDSVTFKLKGDPRRQYLSLAAMLIPTKRRAPPRRIAI